MNDRVYDVVVVGGGPAGLTAGFWLARYRRRVRIIDAGYPRNRATWAVHGYPGLPDLPPAELRKRIGDQAVGAGAELCAGRVTNVAGKRDAFHLTNDDGSTATARRLLLAFGLRDELPPLPGLEQAYGTSVFHCPDCDGPSMVGARVGVYGADHAAAGLALYLLTWADQVSLLTDGRTPSYDQAAANALAAAGIPTRPERIRGLQAAAGHLRAVELDGAGAAPMEALFFHLGIVPGSDLAIRLGCSRDGGGHVAVDSSQETSIRGVFAAGDIVGPPYLAISAAASGARVALAMHRSLMPPERHI